MWNASNETFRVLCVSKRCVVFERIYLCIQFCLSHSNHIKIDRTWSANSIARSWIKTTITVCVSYQTRSNLNWITLHFQSFSLSSSLFSHTFEAAPFPAPYLRNQVSVQHFCLHSIQKRSEVFSVSLLPHFFRVTFERFDVRFVPKFIRTLNQLWPICFDSVIRRHWLMLTCHHFHILTINRLTPSSLPNMCSAVLGQTPWHFFFGSRTCSPFIFIFRLTHSRPACHPSSSSSSFSSPLPTSQSYFIKIQIRTWCPVSFDASLD